MSLIPTPKIYSYIRFSRETQLRGDSLARQRELIERYVSKHGLTLDEEAQYEDLGTPAFRGQNLVQGHFARFLELINTGRVAKGSVLLVESFDRLSRLPIPDALQLFLSIINAGVKIVTLTDGNEHSAESLRGPLGMGTLVASIMVMGRANEESEQKSRRLKHAWETKRQQITKEFYTTRAPSWLVPADGEKIRFKTIPKKAKVVKRMFAMCLAGDHCEGIARKFIKDGVPIVGKRKTWSHSYIAQTLRNPAVTGDFTPHRIENKKRVPAGPTIPNYYPQVVSHSDFHRVQQIMDARSKNKGGRQSPEGGSLFRKILFCGYCGAPVYRTAKGRYYKSGFRRLLACQNAREGNGCHFVSWNYDEFEPAFIAAARELQTSIKQDTVGETLRKEIDALQGERGELCKKRDSLISLVEAGDSASKSELVSVRKRITEHEARITEIDTRIPKLERDYSVALSGPTPVAELQKLLPKLKEPTVRKKVADLVSRLFARIDLFFAGNRFQFQKMRAETARLVRENGKHDNSVSAQMREKFDRRKVRYFEATLKQPGFERRLTFSNSGNLIRSNVLSEVQDLPEEVDPIESAALPPKANSTRRKPRKRS